MITEEEANNRDIEVGMKRIGLFLGTRIKTEYLCSICNEPYLARPDSIWNKKHPNKGHVECINGHFDYDKYVGTVTNNCEWLEISGKLYSKISVKVKCTKCQKIKYMVGRQLITYGLGCCTKQLYDTIRIKELFNRLYKDHLSGGRKTILTPDDYSKLIMMPCEYPGCRSIPYILKKDDLFSTVKVNGIDRINNKKDYEYDNLGILCFGHNKMKGYLNEQELVELEPKWSDYFHKKRDYLTFGKTVVE